MNNYNLYLQTTLGTFNVSVDALPMTLSNLYTYPGMLVSKAVDILISQGIGLSMDDVISVSIIDTEEDN